MPTTTDETPPARSRTGVGSRVWSRCLSSLTLLPGVAWAYWNAGSVPGGNGASAATTVNQGATPTAVLGGEGTSP